MDQNAKKSNTTIIFTVIAVIVIVAIVALAFAFTNKGDNKKNDQNVSSAEQTQSDSNNKLASVQEKINAQEKVINDLNDKLTPLIEERTKLEEQLMQLTSSDTTESTGDVQPDEKVETPEEQMNEEIPADNAQ